RQGRDDVAVFEVGKGYGANEGSSDSAPPVREWWRLGIALAGAARPPHWSRTDRPWDLDDAKAFVELLCERLGFRAPEYRPLLDDPWLHPGRSATVVAPEDGRGAGPGLAGRLGELHPAVAEQLDLGAHRPLVGELAIRGLSRGALAPVRVVPPPRVPAVERDLAVVVAEAVPAGEVAASIRRHGGELLESVRLFDVYRGAPLSGREKSLAHRLRFAADRTLVETEVDEAVGAIAAGLADDVGGRIRG
ncbi:MAG TPA: hypothetical protein VFI28_00025, partial [Candidatus Limnocylindrales bacterium]|nr:hypothetical protein [Candidatus Limnocylindrales bacterium]